MAIAADQHADNAALRRLRERLQAESNDGLEPIKDLEDPFEKFEDARDRLRSVLVR